MLKGEPAKRQTSVQFEKSDTFLPMCGLNDVFVHPGVSWGELIPLLSEVFVGKWRQPVEKARVPHLPEAATKKDVVQGMARRRLHTQSLRQSFWESGVSGTRLMQRLWEAGLLRSVGWKTRLTRTFFFIVLRERKHIPLAVRVMWTEDASSPES